MNNFAQHTERNPRFSSSFESILREQQNPSASSDTNILREDEQPLWLEELLDEPEVDQMLVTRKGHQRSSSDSLAYVDKAYKENKNMTDTQCAKQKLAQRSRIRKVHYIAELERNVQALQAEGSEVSAALNFLDQQNLILGMQNQALKQRLDSLAQERFIKFLEQDLLEKELARLRVLHQSQIQNHHYNHHHQIHSGGRQINLRGLEHQFSTMSLQNKEARS